MEAPKCKICDERHYGLCRAAKLSEQEKADHDQLMYGQSFMLKERGKPAKHVPIETIYPEPPEPPAGMVYSRQVFDRTAYQREYMRKRRAKAKSLNHP